MEKKIFGGVKKFDSIGPVKDWEQVRLITLLQKIRYLRLTLFTYNIEQLVFTAGEHEAFKNYILIFKVIKNVQILHVFSVMIRINHKVL